MQLQRDKAIRPSGPIGKNRNSLENRTVLDKNLRNVSTLLESTLFGGADLCFGGLGTTDSQTDNPFAGLRYDSGAEDKEKIKAKSEVTVVVCNERVEVVERNDGDGGHEHVKYVGTMMLGGTFKPS